VSLPGLVATAAFAFLLSWNNFLFALTLTGSPGMQTLPVLIAALVGEYTTQWNQMMALSVIQSVPLVLIFVGFQRRIISGLTAGAVKG
jgi:multiple sugar transport system permease protein